MDGIAVVVTEVIPIVLILLALGVTVYKMMTSLSTSHVISHLILRTTRKL